MLRVSRFNGEVYRLDGASIALEANGDGPVLFDDTPHWQPYEPDFSATGAALRWSTADVPNWSEAPEEQSEAYRTWWLATFFTELCPTRPHLVIRGEKGSSKTTSVRVLLRLLFGPYVDVCGVPEKRDDLIAMASNSHLVALDNLDEFTPWLRDMLATLSTGRNDEKREYYTTNDLAQIRSRCWTVITARTPDTLQRDDIVDRLLLLSVERIEDAERTREHALLEEVYHRRNAWWGDVLTALNGVVAEIRRAGVPARAGLRMEDWAALGAAMARARGQEDLWERSLERVRTAQGAFLLDENVINSAIETWLASAQYTDSPLLTRELYEHCTNALFGVNRPDSSWPRSVKQFGRRLAGVRRELRDRLRAEGVYMSWDDSHARQMVYTFVK
jgi:hypothetical protein